MTHLRIFKYPENKTYVEVKFDYDKFLFKHLFTRGYKKKRTGWFYKTYTIESSEYRQLYKQDMKDILKDAKYKRVEYFKLLKKISNVEKFLEDFGSSI